MKKSYLNLFLTLVLCLVIAASFSACRGRQTTAVSNEITVIMASIGNNMDPQVANFTNTTIKMNHVYDTLLRLDDSLGLVPAVATSWRTPNNLTYEFVIGEGYRFHNGDPLTMDDIIFSFERLSNIPQTASLSNRIASVSGAGNVLTITLTAPNSAFLRDVAPIILVNRRHVLASGDAYANNPIGTGPYVVEEYIPGDRMVLRAWEDHPFGRARLDKITFRGIAEEVARYIALESGDANFAPIGARDFARAQDNNSLIAVEKQTTNTNFVSMNTGMPPFDNVNIRRAMAHAYDKESFARINPGRVPIDSMFPTMFATYHSASGTPQFSVDEARRLLTAEGYSAANPLRFDVITYGAGDPIIEAYQAILRTVGVEMSIVNMEFGVFLEQMMRGEYQMLSGGWNNTTGSELSAMASYWTGSFGQSNISFFVNDRADELYDIVLRSTNQNEIITSTREVQEIAAQYMPIIPTFRNNVFYGMSRNLRGVEILTNALYSFREAYVE
ncbi:MAG: ABC transporter substrate-binding protein [Treponema sp.]|nr:ABC transporter substrate-binding protein [Treponema sp.]